MRTLAALALVAFVSCTSAPQPAVTPTPVASPGAIALNSAESKATDFRIRLDLLLTEHVIIIAKQSSATSRQAEYASYLRLLTANENDLADLVRSAVGDSVATRFQQIWSAQNDYLVSYTIALATHNHGNAAGAVAGLSGTFAPQLSQFLSDVVTQVPSDSWLPLIRRDMLETKAILDDQFAGKYSAFYAALQTSYEYANELGDGIALSIAKSFPDKFPGNASSLASNLRAFLNIRFQENSYLGTMRTSAAIGRRRAEQAAATVALAENESALDSVLTDVFGAPVTAQFDQVWTAGNEATIRYASAASGATRQEALAGLTNAGVTQVSSWLLDSTDLAAAVSQPVLEAQVEALVTVIDDQRLRFWANLGPHDRSAVTAGEVVADLVAFAAIAKFKARFGE